MTSFVEPSVISAISVPTQAVARTRGGPARVATGIAGRQRLVYVIHQQTGERVSFSFDSASLLTGPGASPSGSFSLPPNILMTFAVPPDQVLYAVASSADLALSIHIRDDASSVTADALDALVALLRQTLQRG